MAFGAHQKPTVGDVKFSAVNHSHLGWILCDGSIVNVSDFQFLFNVIGYSFGGAGTQFRLPQPAGRVPGAIGTGTDQNLSTLTTSLGDTIGEYIHQLTIDELPSHNHGVDNVVQSSFNNSTAVSYTNMSLNDPEHRHTGTTDGAGYAASNHQVAVSATTTGTADDTGSHTHTFTTNNNSTGMTLTDPGHTHSINPVGSDLYHNNVQPTLFMGNMFIYTGLPRYGAWPYQTGSNIW
jgi:microcystin-dependent protein